MNWLLRDRSQDRNTVHVTVDWWGNSRAKCAIQTRKCRISVSGEFTILIRMYQVIMEKRQKVAIGTTRECGAGNLLKLLVLSWCVEVTTLIYSKRPNEVQLSCI